MRDSCASSVSPAWAPVCGGGEGRGVEERAGSGQRRAGVAAPARPSRPAHRRRARLPQRGKGGAREVTAYASAHRWPLLARRLGPQERGSGGTATDRSRCRAPPPLPAGRRANSRITPHLCRILLRHPVDCHEAGETGRCHFVCSPFFKRAPFVPPPLAHAPRERCARRELGGAFGFWRSRGRGRAGNRGRGGSALGFCTAAAGRFASHPRRRQTHRPPRLQHLRRQLAILQAYDEALGGAQRAPTVSVGCSLHHENVEQGRLALPRDDGHGAQYLQACGAGFGD